MAGSRTDDSSDRQNAERAAASAEARREELRETLRSEINHTVANRFSERSVKLSALIERVGDMRQLNSILAWRRRRRIPSTKLLGTLLG